MPIWCQPTCSNESVRAMTTPSYPEFPTQNGYLTERTRQKYIENAVAAKLLPRDAFRMADILSLTAPTDPKKPIQFWQLYSILGQDRIVGIVANFYQRVFEDETWFTSVFEKVGDLNHHIGTQASMWIDVMGGGPYYHGAEFRLNFHHTHNAHQLMNEKGAKRWVSLMVETLDTSALLMTDDARVRPAINTFLAHFLGKYATDFKFENLENFGAINPPHRRKINFMYMTSDAIEALPEDELRDALSDRGVDVSVFENKAQMISKALNM